MQVHSSPLLNTLCRIAIVGYQNSSTSLKHSTQPFSSYLLLVPAGIRSNPSFFRCEGNTQSPREQGSCIFAVTFFRLSQMANADSPISTTDSAISTSVSAGQQKKASLWIVVTPFGILIF